MTPKPDHDADDDEPKSRGGRPLTFDKRIGAAIVKILRSCQPISVALEATNTNEDTFYRWQRRGRKADKAASKGEAITADEKILRKFYRDIKSARAEGKVKLIAVIEKVAFDKMEPKRWQAAAWLLERMYPKEFGRKYIRIENTETGGDGDGGKSVVNIMIEGAGGADE